MREVTYNKMMVYIKKRRILARIITVGNMLATYSVYVSFIIFLSWLVFTNNTDFIRIVCTTGVSFVAVSVFRKIYNRERPYEKFGETPVISKDKKGKSMPSRHVFSAFVIAMTFLFVNNILGIVFLIISMFIAVFRVFGGVHYPSDVIVGGIVGVLCGLVGLWII